jgi:hypothetical protein
MDTLLPTMDMPLPGGYAVMDMFPPTVDMLPPSHEYAPVYKIFFFFYSINSKEL